MRSGTSAIAERTRAAASVLVRRAPAGPVRAARLGHAADARQWSERLARSFAETRLAEVLAAARDVPRHRDVLRELGSAAPFDLLAAMPVLEREALRTDMRSLIRPEVRGIRFDVTYTSGTGGLRSHAVKPVDTVRVRGAVERRLYSSLGFTSPFTIANIVPWSAWGRSRFAFNDWRVGYRELGIPQLAACLAERRPPGAAVMAPPDVLAFLASNLADADWSGVRGVLASFEINDVDRATTGPLADKPWGELYTSADVTAPIAMAYGGCNGMHVNTDVFQVEVLDVAEDRPIGGPGRVVVTDFLNTAMPLLRYEIGDLGSLSPGSSCGCGRPSPILRLHGRLASRLQTAGGGVVAWAALGDRLADIMGEPYLLVRSATTQVEIISANRPDLSRIAAELDPHLPGCTASWHPGDAVTAGLVSDNGRLLVTAPRFPVSEWIKSDPPPRWRGNPRAEAAMDRRPLVRARREVQSRDDRRPDVPRGALLDENASDRVRLRHLARRYYERRGIETDIRILDSGSMAPLLNDDTLVRVRWGQPRDDEIPGSLLVMTLNADLLIVHRGVAVDRSAAGRLILQISDTYVPGDPYAGHWVEDTSVLGMAVAVVSASRGDVIDLTSAFARTLGRISAATTRAVWTADRLRFRHLAAPAARVLQLVVLSAVVVLLRAFCRKEVESDEVRLDTRSSTRGA
jgi:hypothetical protein